jgi:hypothetical protein
MKIKFSNIILMSFARFIEGSYDRIQHIVMLDLG